MLKQTCKLGDAPAAVINLALRISKNQFQYLLFSQAFQQLFSWETAVGLEIGL